ncbi:hypothetical protein RJT34_11403 [Clitoria ternatea]|uniref:glucan endo-1,3-beta-D-glucosidase n=1 Tax=Clitoria ternatea TaxID=43366 RepID=A0AAN9PKH6_CLITE
MFRAFFFLFLFFLPITTAPLPSIGVTYSAATRHSPESITSALNLLNLKSLRLEQPDPSIIRSLLYTNITLFLTIPNYMVAPIAANRSIALTWLYTYVIPFHPRVKITTISVGNAFLDVYPRSISHLLTAISHVHLSLRDLGIRHIAVSTSFSFFTAISSPFPPSAAQFQDPPGVTLFAPLLQFLHDTNSSFLINLYPYNLYRLRPEIPLGTALFQNYPFNFRDDFTTGVRYRNLFDIMVDAVVSALAVAGYESIPVVVTETGWPSGSVAANEAEANLGYAEIYLRGLVKHVRSGMGTPLLKDGVREVFVYEMFDDEGAGRKWGVFYPNCTFKYRIDLSCSYASEINTALILFLLLLVWICRLSD